MARTDLRLPDDLHRRAKAAAEEDRRSMNAELVVLIERGLAERESAKESPAGEPHSRAPGYDAPEVDAA